MSGISLEDQKETERSEKDFNEHLVSVEKNFPSMINTEGLEIPFSGRRSSRITKNLVISESLEGTWLEKPVDNNNLVSDWYKVKRRLPNANAPMGISPHHEKFVKAFPAKIPITFSDKRTEEFLDDKAPLMLSNNVILPSQYFNDPEIPSSNVDKKLFLVERLMRMEFGEDLAQKSILELCFKIVKDMVNGSVVSNDSGTSLSAEIDSLSSLLFMACSISGRSKLLASSNIMLVRDILRDSVLARCSGQVESKRAAKFSDFGAPCLFGAASTDLSAKVINTAFDYKKYRISVTKKRPFDFASGSLPAAKKVAQSNPSSSVATNSNQSFTGARPKNKKQNQRQKFAKKKS